MKELIITHAGRMMRFANSTSSTPRWAHQPGTRAIANSGVYRSSLMAEHTVDQAAEQVHVGADLLRAVLFARQRTCGARRSMLHSSSYSSS